MAETTPEQNSCHIHSSNDMGQSNGNRVHDFEDENFKVDTLERFFENNGILDDTHKIDILKQLIQCPRRFHQQSITDKNKTINDIHSLANIYCSVLTNKKWQNYSDKLTIEDIHCSDRDIALDILRVMASTPCIEDVFRHPFYWSDFTKVYFMSSTVEYINFVIKNLMREKKISILQEFNMHEVNDVIPDQDWIAALKLTFNEMRDIWRKMGSNRIGTNVISELAQKGAPERNSVFELMRFFRNRYIYHHEDNDSIRIAFGGYPSGYLRFFTSRFPNLFMHVYWNMKIYLEGGTNLERYFFKDWTTLVNSLRSSVIEASPDVLLSTDITFPVLPTGDVQSDGGQSFVLEDDKKQQQKWDIIDQRSLVTWPAVQQQTQEQLAKPPEEVSQMPSNRTSQVNPGWKQIKGTEIEYDPASRYKEYSKVFDALRKSGAEPQEAVVKFVTNFNIEDKERMQIYHKREIDNHWDAHTHDNVVTYFQSGVCEYEEKDAIFILMEKCDKKNLSERIKEESLPYIKRAETVKCIARGLQHLKERRILHRDLKPQNILYKGDVGVISDFGLSKKILPEKSHTFQSIPYLGTIGWCAPEIYSDDAKSSFAADIYAAGLVFYFALSNGKHPYGNEPIRQAYINMDLNCNLKPLYQTTDGKVAYDLISLMLSRDPKARPTIEEVLEHPFFWDVNKKIQFYAKICSIIEYRTKKEINSSIFSSQNEVVEAEIKNWKDNLPLTDAEKTNIQYNFEKRDFDEITVQDRVFESFARQIPDSVTRMVRFIRNRFTHSGEDKGKDIIDLTDEQLWEFFNSRCPHLLIHTYHEIKTYYKTKPASDPDYFEEYFKKEDKNNTEL